MKGSHPNKEDSSNPAARKSDLKGNDSKRVLDLKACDVRHRSSDMERIINEMTIGENVSDFHERKHKKDDQKDDMEDELLALIDNEL